MDKRQEERLALEGNSVFTDLRLERDVLKERCAALLEVLKHILSDEYPTHEAIDEARAVVTQDDRNV